MRSVIFHDSGDHMPSEARCHNEFENSGKFPRIEVGHHYLILYPDIQRLHKVYSEYIKGQIQEEPSSIILVLPYFDTTEKVRDVLESNGINVKEREREGSLVIVDIEKVINSLYFELTDVQRLKGFAKQIETKHQGKTILVVADMSAFNHLKKSKELLEYERTLQKDLGVRKWKELCFYHEHDFRAMFTEEEVSELLDYHRDRVITV